MAKGKGGLGRGLESLFEDAAPSFESDTRIETLPLATWEVPIRLRQCREYT